MHRVMPERVYLGSSASSTMAQCMGQQRSYREQTYGDPNPYKLRTVMGFVLPEWQRGFVWDTAQKISFIESAWKGVNLGTYSYNISEKLGSKFDNMLIDGQQRMRAIECYLNNEFKVFGYYWKDVTDVDKRVWGMTTIFASYRTETEDETYLKNYYNLMNFGGTNHKATETA